MTNKIDKDAERVTKALERDGVACSTVSDGIVLVFSRQKLQAILNETVGKETIAIFVKRPNLAN